MIPYQILWNSKPDLQYLKIINSAVYIYNIKNQINSNRRKKFDLKIKKTKFIDYRKGVNQYKIWNSNINRIEKIIFVSIDKQNTTMEEGYAPIHLDYENSNDFNY
jgi:hypothetical protein